MSLHVTCPKCLNNTIIVLNDNGEQQVLNVSLGCLDCFDQYSKQDIITVVQMNNFVNRINGDEKKLSDFLDNWRSTY